MISDSEKIALRDFTEIARQNNISLVLVGAGARLLAFDWKYDLPSSRTTIDWDIGVQVEDWELFQQLQEALVKGAQPLFSKSKVPHRFRHVTGVLIDIIPFGGVEREEGKIIWPEDNMEMTVLGFREVLENAVSVDIGEELSILVATAPGLAVLKLFAMIDRKRDDDLRDLYFILSNYDRAGNEERIFDELSDLLSENVLEYEYAGAYLLGMDVRRLISSQTFTSLMPIIDRLLEPYALELAPLISRIRDERQEEDERHHIATMFRQFKAGIEGF